MTHDPPAARRQVEIVNPLGLHLRPADKFVRLASKFADTDVQVHFKGQAYNGKSLLELTMLAAEVGSRLEIEARGPAAAEAVEALANLVSSHFEEGPDLPQEPGP
jgi:phosphocarrier protein